MSISTIINASYTINKVSFEFNDVDMDTFLTDSLAKQQAPKMICQYFLNNFKLETFKIFYFHMMKWALLAKVSVWNGTFKLHMDMI